MKAGDKVKILDIGPMATVIQPGKREVKVNLEGVEFWIETEFLEKRNGGCVI